MSGNSKHHCYTDPASKDRIFPTIIGALPTQGLVFFTALLLMALVISPSRVFAHAGETHDDKGIVVNADEQQALASANNNLPDEIANIGGPFSLTNHLGEAVTDETYRGKHMLVFFGYSNCQIMCSISLKRIGDALALLQDDANEPLEKFQSLVITVDPDNDTPARLKESLAYYHPALTGLTGTLEQLEPVYKAYGQKPSVLDFDLNNNPVVSHASYFYLMGPDGKLQTFFPPILNSESMAALIKKYVAG